MVSGTIMMYIYWCDDDTFCLSALTLSNHHHGCHLSQLVINTNIRKVKGNDKYLNLFASLCNHFQHVNQKTAASPMTGRSVCWVHVLPIYACTVLNVHFCEIYSSLWISVEEKKRIKVPFPRQMVGGSFNDRYLWFTADKTLNWFIEVYRCQVESDSWTLWLWQFHHDIVDDTLI